MTINLEDYELVPVYSRTLRTADGTYHPTGDLTLNKAEGDVNYTVFGYILRRQH